MKTSPLLLAMTAALLLAGCWNDPNSIANAENAETFLAHNAKKDGVKTLPSGVQYEVVRSGPAGGVSPRKEDLVKVHYEGRLVSGRVFDSSYDRGAPAVMRLGDLIPAWVEALQLMKPGDEWMLYVPPEMGYGDKGAGPIPPNAVLVFRIELIEVAG